MTARRGMLRTWLLMLAGLLAAATLAGCGQTGPLTLPGAAGQSTAGADGDEEEDSEENEQR
jgi:predicted small lipoprotein YifL